MTGDQSTTTGPLGLDPMLLSILACPDTHHSPLTVDEARHRDGGGTSSS